MLRQLIDGSGRQIRRADQARAMLCRPDLRQMRLAAAGRAVEHECGLCDTFDGGECGGIARHFEEILARP